MTTGRHDQGSFLNVHVSFPRASEPSNAGDWEAAIATRIQPGFALVVIVDGTPGAYTIRSAHGMSAGGIGDITPDATRLLHEAGVI